MQLMLEFGYHWVMRQAFTQLKDEGPSEGMRHAIALEREVYAGHVAAEKLGIKDFK